MFLSFSCLKSSLFFSTYSDIFAEYKTQKFVLFAFGNIFYCFLFSIFIWTFSHQWYFCFYNDVSLFIAAIEMFSLSLGFHYDVPRGRFLCIHPTWCIQNLLHLLLGVSLALENYQSIFLQMSLLLLSHLSFWIPV